MNIVKLLIEVPEWILVQIVGFLQEKGIVSKMKRVTPGTIVSFLGLMISPVVVAILCLFWHP